MIPEIYLPYIKNKKVTVMGLGLLGRGVGDTLFLAKSSADIIVTDKKTEEQLSSSLLTLKDFKNIRYTLGEHTLEDFEDRDFILKAAGVPLDSEYIRHAEKSDIPIYMSAAFVCDIVMRHLPHVVIIGVTGTRGKTTTTELIAHILRASGARVHLGGNIRGVANLPLLDEIVDGDFLVLELDSWQLQGFASFRISPHIAVFTSFMDDHMNYYKDDKEAYFNDKANIYRFQKDYDACIVSEQAEEEIRKRDLKKDLIVATGSRIETSLIGEHNQTAVKLAYEVGSQCGIDDVVLREAISTFKAVEGRLEDMGVYSGVRVFNDNNATTPEATVAALNSIYDLYKSKPIIIIGGTDKNLPLETLEKTLQDKTKEIIYLSGTGTDRISLPKTWEYETLEACVKEAFSKAEKGDIILFSPAFASFSKYFNNEYEKSDEFVKQVKKYL